MRTRPTMTRWGGIEPRRRPQDNAIMSSPPEAGADPADNAVMSSAPRVLVFDVNETLIDIESMTPLFEQMFGDPGVLREWFGQLITYSMTITMSGHYVDFFTLGQGVLQMVADIHAVRLTDDDLHRVKDGMLTMPAHPDVDEGLKALRHNGYRLVTLTNSPVNSDGPTPLERAGLADHFERQFSIDTARVYKPATQLYHHVARHLEVPPSACMMVAAHVWDTIGAQSAGFSSALITRPGNAPLAVAGLPQPTLIAADLTEFAQRLGGGKRPPARHDPIGHEARTDEQ